jgi:small-conductance mechanosensitive channel
MDNKIEIGDTVELSEPIRGYDMGEVVDLDGRRVRIRLTSGYEISVWESDIAEVYR